MSNFFAQPDALAYGKVNSSTVFGHMCFMNCFGFLQELTASFQTPEQLRSENVSENLIPHKVITVHHFYYMVIPVHQAYHHKCFLSD
jgi:hypothetical protein